MEAVDNIEIAMMVRERKGQGSIKVSLDDL